ncbi:anti-sigma factor [Streptantibioticus parmotrematis]|uniref:anti-sigma factor n=1 Tax=Streptantibioticus parmotrematis TaxID=2873249 RepID=UPI00340FBCB6
MTTIDLHTLTGAYALDALPETEEREFAGHLEACEACAREVAELRETAARLALAVAEVPPTALRSRVMAAIPEVRQLPPRARQDTVRPLRARGWRQRMPYLAAAACLVGAAVAGGVAVNAEHEADQARAHTARAEQQAAQVQSVLAAPDATVRTAALKGGGIGTVVASKQLGRTAFLYSDLPALPGSHVYELWYSRNGTMVPAGLVASGSTSGSTVLAGAPAGAGGVGVTVEPHGGSPRPTTAPVLLVPLS